MIVKNVNTHAHGDIHLVVLAHLRRRWNLSSRDGFDEFLEVFFTVFNAPNAGFGSIGRWLWEHRTLVLRASDAGRVSGEYIVLPVLLHRTLKWYCSCVRWLHDISSFFKSSCAPDTVAFVFPPSDVSGERKSSLVAYWSASDAWHQTLSAGRRTRPVLTETTVEL
jgi:hypothetical protein